MVAVAAITVGGHGGRVLSVAVAMAMKELSNILKCLPRLLESHLFPTLFFKN